MTDLFDPVPALATELHLPAERVRAALGLLDEGNTVPFVARYRKEVTGGLSDAAIHEIQERRAYLRDLDERRQTVLASIGEQGKLTDDLRGRILSCSTKAALEDLYLPHRPRRRTRATIARERGLEPLAREILAQGSTDPESLARGLVNSEAGVPDAAAALAGARDIVAETVAETPEVRDHVRRLWRQHALVTSSENPKREPGRTRFEQYYDFREKVATIPSHRYLALRRGENDHVLKVQFEVDAEQVLPGIERRMQRRERSPCAALLREAIEDSYRRLLAPSLETELHGELKERSDHEAVKVFADNLRALLLAAPLGQRTVLGIDPGFRTGCKCAAVDDTGKFVGETVIHPTRDPRHARKDLLHLVKKYRPEAIAVGNGTGGRETESFVRQTLLEEGLADTLVVSVNEAGASIYSASETAREEFPDLDVTVRGAISIARRLQDPLAELVKIDPKSIGVGQYQHDVHQPLLLRKLDEVVESCVNLVGVELNTASAALLTRVAGIGAKVARAIVEHREAKGAFTSRKALLKVAGLGPRTFEQAAGFLRLHGATHPLDASAVHPERYTLVERMAKDVGAKLTELVGNGSLAGRIQLERYVSESVGEPTLRDILTELEKPGRDPRDEFQPPKFRDDVQKVEDLQEGMTLEGVVTNVTAFGAFVDVGVHQDGLVHVSQLADRYVKDPREVVRPGDRLEVRVLSVDLERRRIALSARKEGKPAGRAS